MFGITEISRTGWGTLNCRRAVIATIIKGLCREFRSYVSPISISFIYNVIHHFLRKWSVGQYVKVCCVN
jgi:hypothetical protein